MPGIAGQIDELQSITALIIPGVGEAQEARDAAPEAGGASTVILPVETFLVPVTGPNTSGEVPPLDKRKALSQSSAMGILAGEIPGQWYNHYAYFDIGGTRVEQYTNFQETNQGQYINMERWSNNNGGVDRWLQDNQTGFTSGWLGRWLNSGPTLYLQQEYTDGAGTLIHTNFRATSAGCPCWPAEVRVGSH